MSDYIEKDQEGSFIDTTFNGSSSSTAEYMATAEKTRWDWIINGWDKMTFQERMSLFYPTLHFINLNDSYPETMDANFQENMVQFGYDNCRVPMKFHYDDSRINSPQVAVEYGPVYFWNCPDEEIVSKIKAFYTAYIYPQFHHKWCDCNEDADYIGSAIASGVCSDSCTCKDTAIDSDAIYKY